MDSPCFILDLNPHWQFLDQNYMQSPARLVGTFHSYLGLVLDMYKAITNDTSEDEVLIDHYLNGSCVLLTPADEEATRQAVLRSLDLVITLADVCGSVNPGKIVQCPIDYVSRTVLIQFGGDHDQA
ncbi:hypothetical protein ACSA002_2230 [Salmonella phage vB_SalM_SA002]|nr:hypothetical protein ACSA002_2230 [Salmonella phage vB_SalM_SA002]